MDEMGNGRTQRTRQRRRASTTTRRVSSICSPQSANDSKPPIRHFRSMDLRSALQYGAAIRLRGMDSLSTNEHIKIALSVVPERYIDLGWVRPRLRVGRRGRPQNDLPRRPLHRRRRRGPPDASLMPLPPPRVLWRMAKWSFAADALRRAIEPLLPRDLAHSHDF